MCNPRENFENNISYMIIEDTEGAQYLGIGSIKSFLVYDPLDRLKQLGVTTGHITVSEKII